MAYQLYQVRSGKTGRVVAKTRKLTTARKRAAGLIRRGSKRVSIMRGGKSFPIAGATRRRRRSRKSSHRKSSHRKSSRRRSSRRRSSRRRTTRNRRRRSRRNSRRRSSHRRR